MKQDSHHNGEEAEATKQGGGGCPSSDGLMSHTCAVFERGGGGEGGDGMTAVAAAAALDGRAAAAAAAAETDTIVCLCLWSIPKNFVWRGGGGGSLRDKEEMLRRAKASASSPRFHSNNDSLFFGLVGFLMLRAADEGTPVGVRTVKRQSLDKRGKSVCLRNTSTTGLAGRTYRSTSMSNSIGKIARIRSKVWTNGEAESRATEDNEEEAAAVVVAASFFCLGAQVDSNSALTFERAVSIILPVAFKCGTFEW
jgi:hypothetical protein